MNEKHTGSAEPQPTPQAGMTEQERADLQRAVSILNDVMAGLYARHGQGIRVVPRVNYSMDEGYAAVFVEVTTGVEEFR